MSTLHPGSFLFLAPVRWDGKRVLRIDFDMHLQSRCCFLNWFFVKVGLCASPKNSTNSDLFGTSVWLGESYKQGQMHLWNEVEPMWVMRKFLNFWVNEGRSSEKTSLVRCWGCQWPEPKFYAVDIMLMFKPLTEHSSWAQSIQRDCGGWKRGIPLNFKLKENLLRKPFFKENHPLGLGNHHWLRW